MAGGLVWLVALAYQGLSGVVRAEHWLYLVVGSVALITSAILLVVRNALYVALAFVVTVISFGILLLFQGAAFLMAALLIIYAGTIVVTFLFIIMLAQQRGQARYDAIPREPLLACLAGWALSVSLAWLVTIHCASEHSQRSEEESTKRAHSARVREMTPKLISALGAFKRALELQKPREDLIEILDVRPWDGIVFTKGIEILRSPRTWNEDRAIREYRVKIEQAYESLLTALREEPLDYKRAQQETEHLSVALQKYSDWVQGAHALTVIDSTTNTRGLGRALFGYYYLPVQLAGFLLLLATIGSLIIGKPVSRRSREVSNG